MHHENWGQTIFHAYYQDAQVYRRARTMDSEALARANPVHPPRYWTDWAANAFRDDRG